MAAGTNLVDPTAAPGSPYDYGVESVGAGGLVSLLSMTAHVVTGLDAPVLSVGVGAMNMPNPTLTWPAVAGATQYHVYRGFTPSPLAVYLTTASTQLTDYAVPAGNNVVYYQVVAASSFAQSAPSAESNVPVSSALMTPPPPNVVGSPMADSVTLSWLGSPTPASYRVVRFDTNLGIFAVVGTPAAPASPVTVLFTDTTAASGATYTYRLQAVTASGGGSYSSGPTMVTVP